MIVGNIPMGIVGSGGGAYNPGMMTFDGSTGYYNRDITTSGNKVTLVFRLNRASFTGGADESVTICGGLEARFRIIIYSSDHASADRRNKLFMWTESTTDTTLSLLFSIDDVADGNDHTVFYEYDGDAGTSVFYIDGVDADDTGHASRSAPIAGTLNTGPQSVDVGAFSDTGHFGGQIGYYGVRDISGLTPSDFYHPTNGLQELDESGWTEWGAQPLVWNSEGDLDVSNAGSEAVFTKFGTITGPS